MTIISSTFTAPIFVPKTIGRRQSTKHSHVVVFDNHSVSPNSSVLSSHHWRRHLAAGSFEL